MANLSAIFRESAKYLRERERDPRSARLSFEVMLIKLGYIIQQMRKGGGRKTRAYIRNGSHRENSIYSFTFFFFRGFAFFPRLSCRISNGFSFLRFEISIVRVESKQFTTVEFSYFYEM